MASSRASVDEVDRQLQAVNMNEFKVMTINMGTGSGKEARKVSERRPTVKMVIKKNSPNIIFLQEIPAPKLEPKKLDLQTEYDYIGRNNEAGILWFKKSFKLVEEIAIDKKRTARDTMDRKRTARDGVSRSGLYDELPVRTCVVLLQQEITNKNKTGKYILVISWHGPYKNKDKQHLFSALLEYVLEIREYYKRQLPPIVIGGDFNLDLEELKSKSPELFKGFVLCPYQPTGRREDKEIIDYFLYSGDVEIGKVEALELNKDSPNCPFTAEELKDKDLYAIDHDPLVGQMVFKPTSSEE